MPLVLRVAVLGRILALTLRRLVIVRLLSMRSGLLLSVSPRNVRLAVLICQSLRLSVLLMRGRLSRRRPWYLSMLTVL